MVAAPKGNARIAAIPYQPIAANAKFVTTVGTQFVLNGKLYYPGGTNWCGVVFRQAAPAILTFSPRLRVYLKDRAWKHINSTIVVCTISAAPHRT